MNPKRKRLEEARIGKGLTQEEMAEHIGVSRNTVSQWERGCAKPYPIHIRKLQSLFGCSASELGFVTEFCESADRAISPAVMENRAEEKTLADTEQNIREQPFSFPQKQRNEAQEIPSSLSQAISSGILSAVRGFGDRDMSKDRREFLSMLSTSFVLSGFGGDLPSFIANALSSDHMTFLEKEIAARWIAYHKGNTIQAHNGLHLWLEENERFAKEIRNNRAHALVSISYQLQGSIFRDKMDYNQAHKSFARAFIAADEFGSHEFKASSLARRGVTFIQQQKPIEAIQYLESALATIDGYDFPYLKGYIFQALSEAYAMARHKDQSLESINQADHILVRKGQVVENSNCQLNTTSIIAQRGVNAVLLGEHSTAIDLLDMGLLQYDPTLLRGRARLIAQKSEAYYALKRIEESVLAAKEALTIARSIGSKKTIKRVGNVHASLAQSFYRKEKSVVELTTMLSTAHE